MSGRSEARTVRQTWLKDTGSFEINWRERAPEKLASFLEAMEPKPTYVKAGSTQHLGDRRESFVRKMALYRRFGVTP